MSVFTDLGKALITSRGTGEDDHVYKWRLFAALTIWWTVMSLWTVTALAFGFVQLFGFTGFATKAEAQQVQHLVKEIRISQLENALRDYRIRQCQAQMEGNQAALDAATSNLREKGNVYWQLTGRSYMPETCDALLVARR